MSKSNIEVTFTGWVATAPTFHRPDPAKPEKALSTFRVMHTPYYRDNHGNWQKGRILNSSDKSLGLGSALCFPLYKNWGPNYCFRTPNPQ